MTTNVTVKTHDWPVKVQITDQFQSDTLYSYRAENVTVEPNSERTFYLTQSQSLHFSELPKPEENESQE